MDDRIQTDLGAESMAGKLFRSDFVDWLGSRSYASRLPLTGQTDTYKPYT